MLTVPMLHARARDLERAQLIQDRILLRFCQRALHIAKRLRLRARSDLPRVRFSRRQCAPRAPRAVACLQFATMVSTEIESCCSIV